MEECNECSERLGEIQLILGPMFSGKTTELLRRYRRYQVVGRRCLLIKHGADKRYSETKVSTHCRQEADAIVLNKLDDFREWACYDVICIDEGQFFPDVTEISEFLANNGKIVIVAALDGTWQRKPFENIANLISASESIVKLTAVCMICKRDAPFTKRTCDDTALEVIGGADKYMAVCRRCFHEPITSTKR